MCRKHIKKRDMAETRSNSSVFNVQAKVLKSLQDLHLNKQGALTLKDLVDSADSMHGTAIGNMKILAVTVTNGLVIAEDIHEAYCAHV